MDDVLGMALPTKLILENGDDESAVCETWHSPVGTDRIRTTADRIALPGLRLIVVVAVFVGFVSCTDRGESQEVAVSQPLLETMRTEAMSGMPSMSVGCRNCHVSPAKGIATDSIRRVTIIAELSANGLMGEAGDYIITRLDVMNDERGFLIERASDRFALNAGEGRKLFQGRVQAQDWGYLCDVLASSRLFRLRGRQVLSECTHCDSVELRVELADGAVYEVVDDCYGSPLHSHPGVRRVVTAAGGACVWNMLW